MTSARTRRRLLERMREAGIVDETVLAIMDDTPRHLFLDEALGTRAYEDTALPIGFRQTISQPYIVARMTVAVTAGRRCGRILEIGTGSGYQTAVLARLADEVFTVERIKPLLNAAMTRLYRLRVRNVRFRHADGGDGWPAHAPYDAIVVTAAVATIPAPWLEQLAPGGRLVVPVGDGDERQQLTLLVKTGNGFETEILEACRFVPMLEGKE